VADLVAALDGAPQRASARLACHVLEAIQGIESSNGAAVALSTGAERPEPLQPSSAGGSARDRLAGPATDVR